MPNKRIQPTPVSSLDDSSYGLVDTLI